MNPVSEAWILESMDWKPIQNPHTDIPLVVLRLLISKMAESMFIIFVNKNLFRIIIQGGEPKIALVIVVYYTN